MPNINVEKKKNILFDESKDNQEVITP